MLTGLGDLVSFSFPLSLSCGSGGSGPSADLLSPSAGGTESLVAGGLARCRGTGETERAPSSISMGSGSA